MFLGRGVGRRWTALLAVALLLLAQPALAEGVMDVTGCGNGKCDGGETQGSCCIDCPCAKDASCTPLGCITTVQMDSIGVDNLLKNVSYSEGTANAIKQARDFSSNFALAFSCGECITEILIPGREMGKACDECAAGMDSFAMGFFWAFDVDREEFASYCGEESWQWGELIVPKEIVMFGFLLALLAVIFHFMGVHGRVKFIESESYEKIYEKFLAEANTWFKIMKPVYEKVLKMKRKEEGTSRDIVTFKLTVAALGLVSFVLAMGVAYLLAMYFLGDGFECAVFGFKLALGFTWAYFLVIVFAEAVTSFGVEEVTDSDLDEYVKGMSDKDKEVLTNVTATDEERKFRPQGHDEAKENALLKDRLKKAMGWANLRGSEGKKEIGYFYLEDFIGIPNFLAKLVIDPFRHPIGRTLICLILFDMFDPIRWDWNLLIGMNMVVFGAYLALCLEWELKGVLVSIAAHISDLFVGAVKKTTGAIRKASAALHSSDSKKKESS